MTDISQGVFKIQGLIAMLAAKNAAQMQTRMEMVEIGRSAARALILDADKESFERVQTPLGGVPEILDHTWKRLAAAAEMPVTVLMGVSPAGLNATGESDIRLWYDSIQSAREHVAGPRIERLVRLVARTLGQGDPSAWKVTWPSLWQMSAPERAAYRKTIAEADKIYMDAGVLLPEEVALSRFAGGPEFNGDTTTIDTEARKAALEAAVQELTKPTPPAPPAPTGGALPPDGSPPKALPAAPAPEQQAA